MMYYTLVMFLFVSYELLLLIFLTAKINNNEKKSERHPALAGSGTGLGGSTTNGVTVGSTGTTGGAPGAVWHPNFIVPKKKRWTITDLYKY